MIEIELLIFTLPGITISILWNVPNTVTGIDHVNKMVKELRILLVFFIFCTIFYCI